MKNQSTPNTLSRFIQASLPWSSNNNIANIHELNPKYKHFYNLGTEHDDVIAKHSVSTMTPDDPGITGMSQVDKNYSAYMYANVDTDKVKRLLDYRMMAAYAEVGDAIDEVCDDILYEDDNGKFVGLNFREDVDLDSSIKQEIEKEFTKIIRYFDLE